MTGPVAIVTGAGSGLGRVIARALLADGWAVGLAGRRAEPLADTAGDHTEALAVPTDVGDAESVSALFGAVTDRWGRVDLLVNNAGAFGPAGTPDEIGVDAWRAAVDTNLTGSFLCAREAFAIMRRQDPRGGRIINNGSISAHSPRPGSIAYTATKHAITGLTKSLSLDGRPFDIACGQIDIGNAATEMTQGIATGAKQADGAVRPEPTFDAQHVADAVRYMAGLPLAANVQFLTITATTMPFIGRG
ncbi:SDR family oxidoreductase [Pseudonocardia spinosispora]|uniref:SDR family oxidoreductase n=1 Tax=Pseudonocardia spinosispora TaxID=103441 RepID=UPI00040EFE0A|nr:SDR family oxidoreductase [Pseudonocardia spinosispora]